jgi:hypothetical protein
MRQHKLFRVCLLGISLFSFALTPSARAQGSIAAVRINEVLASNDLYPAPDGSVTDMLELYNNSAFLVDLTGASLSDSNSHPRRYVFPAGTTIAPFGRKVMTFDSSRPASSSHVPFGIKASGGFLFLYSASDPLNHVSMVEYGLLPKNLSISCIPEGGTNWVLSTPTFGTANSAVALGPRSGLKINEWMANPASGEKEYFEVYNAGTAPVALAGLRIGDGGQIARHLIVPSLSFIGTGAVSGFLVFREANTNMPPKYPADEVGFGLGTSDSLAIYEPGNPTPIEFVNWSGATNDVSHGRLPDGAATFALFPEINDYETQSPGEPNFLILTNIYVNELLAHTDPPLEDAVEFQNRSGTAVNIGGWWLSNSRLNPKKYQIPAGTTIAAGGFRVFYEGVGTSSGFNSSGAAQPFTFNSAHGDKAVLSQVDGAGNLTGYVIYEEFESSANGVSFGHYRTSVPGDYKFVAMAETTFGADEPNNVAEFRTGTGLTNSYPRVGPLVINEIMFAPSNTIFGTNITAQQNPDEEFIELRNITSTVVPMYDPQYPTNRWRLQNAVDFSFPFTNIQPNEIVLVVGFNPHTNAAALANFRNRFAVNASTKILGPWIGRLADDGEAVELYRPDTPQLPPRPDAGFVPFIRVDKVNYESAPPWPGGANATGSSLQRKNSLLFGNDPINWAVSAPTPGRETPSTLQDTDGDGMPDAWETQYSFNPNNPNDAGGDADGDTITNLGEYISGTHPRQASSVLKVAGIAPIPSTNVVVRFLAYSNTTYTVQYRNSLLPSSDWQKLVDVPAAPTNRMFEAQDLNAHKKADRYYRVVAPATN